MSNWNTTLSVMLDIPSERARLVEGFLRCEHRSLNSLTAQQIRTAYGEIGGCIDADPALADRLATSYGL